MILDKITKARAGLVLDQPFFGSLALRLKVIEDKTCQTAWTDGQSLGFNPEFVDGLTLEQTKGLLAHEVMHCACAHHARRSNRDAKKWNMAGDYAINQILLDSNFILPDGALVDRAYKDKSADDIYSLLPEPDDQDGQDDPGGCGEVRDTKGQDGQALNNNELSQQDQKWKVATVQAAQQAKMCGQLPASLDRLVGEIVNPKIDWRTILRQFIETSARNDYSWTHPNRRYIQQGLYLPSLRSEELPEIIISIDTSGSIRQKELDQFAGEISSILEEYDTTIDVLYCDSKIAGHEVFTREDLPLNLNPKGGGGTRFAPPFEWVNEQGKTPACLVYLSDMQCWSYPESAPDYPVLWVATGQGSKPPFGELIEM